MSLVQIRGGVPRVMRDDAVLATGRKFNFPFYSAYLIVRLADSTGVKVFFTEDDFDNDENYITLPPAAGSTRDEWAGPAELDAIWVKSAGVSSAIEIVVFQRRG